MTKKRSCAATDCQNESTEVESTIVSWDGVELTAIAHVCLAHKQELNSR